MAKKIKEEELDFRKAKHAGGWFPTKDRKYVESTLLRPKPDDAEWCPRCHGGIYEPYQGYLIRFYEKYIKKIDRLCLLCGGGGYVWEDEEYPENLSTSRSEAFKTEIVVLIAYIIFSPIVLPIIMMYFTIGTYMECCENRASERRLAKSEANQAKADLP